MAKTVLLDAGLISHPRPTVKIVTWLAELVAARAAATGPERARGRASGADVGGRLGKEMR